MYNDWASCYTSKLFEINSYKAIFKLKPDVCSYNFECKKYSLLFTENDKIRPGFKE